MIFARDLLSSEDLVLLSWVVKWSALIPLVYLVWFSVNSYIKKSFAPKDNIVIIASVILPQVLYITSWIIIISARGHAIDERIKTGHFFKMCGTYQGMQYFPKIKRWYAKVQLDDATIEYGSNGKIDHTVLNQLLVNERVCVKYLKDLPLGERMIGEKLIFAIDKEK